MKTVKNIPTIFTLLLAFLLTATVFAEQSTKEIKPDNTPKSICPTTKISDNDRCLLCHAVIKKRGNYKFVLKETSPFADLVPPRNTRWGYINGDIVLRYNMESISAAGFEDFVEYARSHKEVKRLIIDLFSPGGSVMGGWKIVSLINELRKEGFVVETRGYGLAASAAFLILTHGEPALVSPYTELMWHELRQWKLIFGVDVTTPSDSAEKARILRHFQDDLNQFLADRSGMDKNAIDDKIRFSEWWMNGKEAVALGFADGYLVE